MTARRRLDAELVRRGLVESRSRATELIGAGRVLVGGAVATKPARLVATGEPVLVQDEPPPFVSRGGHKLAAALDRWPIALRGKRVIDVGSSTGGFTDCALQTRRRRDRGDRCGEGAAARAPPSRSPRRRPRADQRAGPGSGTNRRSGRRDRVRPVVHLAPHRGPGPGPPLPQRGRPDRPGETPIRGREEGGQQGERGHSRSCAVANGDSWRDGQRFSRPERS